MDENEFEIGSVVGGVDRGSRWRARLVPLSAGDVVKVGFVPIVDDEGVPITEDCLCIGMVLDPDAYFLVEPPCAWAREIPVFGIMDHATITKDGHLERKDCPHSR